MYNIENVLMACHISCNMNGGIGNSHSSKKKGPSNIVKHAIMSTSNNYSKNKPCFILFNRNKTIAFHELPRINHQFST